MVTYGDFVSDKCPAVARHKVTKFSDPHSFPCQKPQGHEGAHEYRRDTRTVIWFGDAKPHDNTKLRFGKWLEDR